MAEDDAAERAREEQELDRLEDIGRKTIKVAASAVVATSLASALSEPPRAELMSLPEPTPLVQMYEAADEDPLTDEDEETDEKQSRLKRLLRMLKYLATALALVGSILFGALKGCAGCAGSFLLPPADEQQEEAQHAPRTQTEDERGVAVGA